jgi:hypothetical protein
MSLKSVTTPQAFVQNLGDGFTYENLTFGVQVINGRLRKSIRLRQPDYRNVKGGHQSHQA